MFKDHSSRFRCTTRIHESLPLSLVRSAEYNCPMGDGIETQRLGMLLGMRLELEGGCLPPPTEMELREKE